MFSENYGFESSSLPNNKILVIDILLKNNWTKTLMEEMFLDLHIFAYKLLDKKRWYKDELK